MQEIEQSSDNSDIKSLREIIEFTKSSGLMIREFTDIFTMLNEYVSTYKANQQLWLKIQQELSDLLLNDDDLQQKYYLLQEINKVFPLDPDYKTKINKDIKRYFKEYSSPKDLVSEKQNDVRNAALGVLLAVPLDINEEINFLLQIANNELENTLVRLNAIQKIEKLGQTLPDTQALKSRLEKMLNQSTGPVSNRLKTTITKL